LIRITSAGVPAAKSAATRAVVVLAGDMDQFDGEVRILPFKGPDQISDMRAISAGSPKTMKETRPGCSLARVGAGAGSVGVGFDPHAPNTSWASKKEDRMWRRKPDLGTGRL
jgi:hypothetical protein